MGGLVKGGQGGQVGLRAVDGGQACQEELQSSFLVGPVQMISLTISARS